MTYFDKFGSLCRDANSTYIDLTPLKSKFLISKYTSGDHLYHDEYDNLCRGAFACSLKRVYTPSYDAVDEMFSALSDEGVNVVHYMMNILVEDGRWYMRAGYVTGIEARFSVEKPMTMKEHLGICDNKKFPHSCPKCRAPAYVGFLQIDCSNEVCR